MKYEEVDRPLFGEQGSRGEVSALLDALEATATTGKALHVAMSSNLLRGKYASNFYSRQRCKDKAQRLSLHTKKNSNGTIVWATKREQR